MKEHGYAEAGGARFYYEVAGQGDPIVFVHAGIADGRMWDAQFDFFARQYRVLRYDRRGFGNTAMVAGAFSNHRDLHALLEFFEIDRAYLVGCSQGAKTIIDFALEHPQMARALVVVSPALSGFTFAGELPKQAEQLEVAEEAGDVEQVNELELQIWVDGPQRSPDQVDAKVRELVREMNLIALKTPENLGSEQPLEPPAANQLGGIRAPSLVIIGNLDTPKTLAAADFITDHIAGARKVVMTGTAHLPNMEQPEEFNRHVLSFLDSQS
jgi:pimeloyl-ACP methyl ester carboxylesterase